MASVLRWCGFPGICTLWYSPEHPGCGVPKCGVCGESGTNSTRECFLILFADAVKRNFQDCRKSFHDTKVVR